MPKLSEMNPLALLRKKFPKKEVKMGDEKLEQRVSELEQAQELLAQKANTLPELKSYLDSKLEELGTRLVELTNRPDEGEIEQRGIKQGQGEVASAFENNALVGELEPIAKRIFDAIRSQGYDIVPKEQQAEQVATGEEEPEEGKAEEIPEPPYLHIIDHPEEGYSPWTEGKFAKLVEAV